MVSIGFLKFPYGYYKIRIPQCINPTSKDRLKRYSNNNISGLFFMLGTRRLAVIQPITGCVCVPHLVMSPSSAISPLLFLSQKLNNNCSQSTLFSLKGPHICLLLCLRVPYIHMYLRRLNMGRMDNSANLYHFDVTKKQFLQEPVLENRDPVISVMEWLESVGI